MSFDAVSLGIMWDRLISISDEIVETLVRTSFSTIVREGYDLSVMLFDRTGAMMVQGTRSIPVFIGTAPATLAFMLERFPAETLAPGDVVITNDPMMGTGHLFDISVMRPVFRAGALVGFTMSITHLPDIGGMGFSAAATEMFHEGLRLPVCKLYDSGRVDAFIIALIRANVRVPEQVIGDIMANVSCNEVGAAQLLAFMDEYGIDDLAPLSEAIRAQSERAMRDRIRLVPDGTYRNRIAFEGIDGPLHLACTIVKAGDGMSIDFAGSPDTVLGGINVPFCYARAMALYSIKCLTAPTIPNNAGSTAPVRVSAPPGCILNAQPPAATAGRHIVGHFVTSLIFGALAEVMPDQVQADCGMMNILTFQGRHPDGRAVVDAVFRRGRFWGADRAGWLCDDSRAVERRVRSGGGLGEPDGGDGGLEAAAAGVGGRWAVAGRHGAGDRAAERQLGADDGVLHGEPDGVCGAGTARRQGGGAAGAPDQRGCGGPEGTARAGAGGLFHDA